MPVATLTSKGQVTIPKAVREQLHLQTGDRLDFQVTADGSVNLRPLSLRVAEVRGCLGQYAPRRPPSAAEMKAGVRRALAGKHRKRSS